MREAVEPRLLLSDFLRHALGLTGTHVGCEHGVCGACTVRVDGVAVRVVPAARGAGRRPRVETVEGLAGGGPLDTAAGGLPPPPRAAVRLLHAGDPRSRRATSSSRERPHPTREVVDMLSGHLCRCTGYAPIVRRDPRGRCGSREALRVNLAAVPARRGGADARRGGARRRSGESGTESFARGSARIATARRLGVAAGRRVALVLDNRARDRAALLGVPVGWARCSSRSRGGSPTEELDYCVADCGAVRASATATRLPDGPEHPGALDLDERATVAHALHVGHDRTAEGRAALAPRRPGRWLVAGAPARVRAGATARSA